MDAVNMVYRVVGRKGRKGEGEGKGEVCRQKG